MSREFLENLYIQHLIAPNSSGPTLVFLHHGLGSVSLWRDFPQKLSTASHLPALLYDRPGHGRTPTIPVHPGHNRHHIAANQLRKLLEKERINNFILVGHSDGGTIALLYATLPDAPPPVGIITEAAHLFVEDSTRVGIRATADLYSSGMRGRLARHHGDKVDTLFWDWAGAWLSPQFDSWNIRDQLHAVRCPVWALQGADDEYGTTAQLDAIAASVSGPVKTVIIPACAHEPHLQAADATLEVMQQAIRSFQGV